MRKAVLTICVLWAAMVCAACGGGADGADYPASTPAARTETAGASATPGPRTERGSAVTATPSAAPDDEQIELREEALFMPDGEMEIRQPRIIIHKSERVLTLMDGDTPVARVCVGLGFAPEGDKEREGDGRTPVGEYYVCTRNERSRFYLSLGLSYPSVKDAERGYEAGLIDGATRDAIISRIEEGKRPPWDTALGGEIMIHGDGGGSDWTAGCVAVDNAVMDLLFEVCGMGTKITIVE